MSTNRNRPRARAQTRRRSPLPLLLMAGGLVLIIALIGLNLAGGGEGGGTPDVEVSDVQVSPEAAVDGLQVDFGDMQLGAENASVTVSVTNTGDGLLRFAEQPYVELAAGCWPPKAAIGSMALQPGETTTVNVVFTMHDDMGGFHDFRLHLPSNDPDEPDTVVKILSNWVE